MVDIDIRSLIYHHLQPMAQMADCQLFIADAASHKSFHDSLEKKAKVLKFDQHNVRELYEALNDYGCIAILKSKKYLGAPELAPFFSKIGLKASDIYYLNSTNASKHEVWGDLDASIPIEKRMFFYWFAVRISDNDGSHVFDKYISEDVNMKGQ